MHPSHILILKGKYIRNWVENILFCPTIVISWRLKWTRCWFFSKNKCYHFQKKCIDYISIILLKYSFYTWILKYSSYTYFMKVNQLFGDIKGGKSILQIYFFSLSVMPQSSLLFWNSVDSKQIHWDYY